MLIVAGALIVIGYALSVDIGGSAERYVRELSANRPLRIAGGLITAIAALLLSIGARGSDMVALVMMFS